MIYSNNNIQQIAVIGIGIDRISIPMPRDYAFPVCCLCFSSAMIAVWLAR